MDTFRAVIALLNRRERWHFALILMLMLPNALMQVAGVASVMPFIAVLAQPDLVYDNAMLAWGYAAVGEPELYRFLVLLAAAALLLLLLSNALAALTTWLTLRFTYMRTHSLSRGLLAKYLEQPYEFFLQRNPAELSRNVIEEVNQLVNGYLMPLLKLGTFGTVTVAILALLVMIDPVVAIAVGLLLGGAYTAVFWALRRLITKFGQRRLEANRIRFKANHEALSAIKDLKVSGREGYYLETYGNASYKYARNQANYSVLSQLPRYALESIAFGSILAIALYLVTVGPSTQSALPMVALYAMAGYRLMPALQHVFDNFTRLRFSAPAVQRIIQEMDTAASPVDKPSSQIQSSETPPCSTPLHLREHLELTGICYTYHGMQTPVLRDINIRIEARTTVAIVGGSGAGKSTLVDIVLGLLEPTQGKVLVDGQELTHELLPEWRKHVGYVPQSIYLSDDTLRRNIALGIPDRHIDEEAVREAAKAAAIHDFITNDLPNGYDTVAGDRGVRLSGGQRQRIGIARALYHRPDVLILDEATSALDGSTEAAVLQAIEQLSGQITIIMIAHRLTTVRGCDQLHLLERGELVTSGTYDELLSKQPEFRKMAHPHSA